MKFSIEKSIEILLRTPVILHSFLNRLSEDWLKKNEGEGTWSPYDILGHLIAGEKNDWMVRVKIILEDRDDRKFHSFDRFAQFKEDPTTPVEALLEEFTALRQKNIEELRFYKITEAQLQKTGEHPVFGEVTLEQLLSTWVVHDLGHIAQVSRVMAKQYKEEVGPWIEYLRILKS